MGGKYLLSLFVIGLSPGICEEIMFRGTMMRAYESMGKNKAIIYTSILFGIFHLNLQNLIGPIFLGLVLSILVYKTNSIYASILGHGISNSIAMTLGYWANKTLASADKLQAYEIPYRTQQIITLIWFGIFASISGLMLRKLLKNLPGDEVVVVGSRDKIKFTDLIPVILVVVIFIIVNTKYLYL